MTEPMKPGVRVQHVDGERGTVADLEDWDEDSPVDEPQGTRTRVEWDSGIREWVHTEDLAVMPDDRNGQR